MLVSSVRASVAQLCRSDSDSLVDFYEGLVRIARHRPMVFKSVVGGVQVDLFITGAESSIKLLNRGPIDKLSHGGMKRYLHDRDDESFVGRMVYDLLDAYWRQENGQQVDVPVEIEC